MGNVCCGGPESPKVTKNIIDMAEHANEDSGSAAPSSLASPDDVTNMTCYEVGTDLKETFASQNNGDVPSIITNKCLHGIIKDNEFLKRSILLGQLIQALHAAMISGAPFSLAVMLLLREPEMIMDDMMITYTFSLATDMTKEGNLPMVKMLVALAKTFQACLQAGSMDVFCRVVDAAHKKKPILPPPEWYRTWMASTMYNDDTAAYIQKHIPCECLKENVAIEKRVRVCLRCQKIETDKTFLLCGKCLLARYCSKECTLMI
jgi:hypothetical protein